MEIVKDFDEKSYNNNGKPWKSPRIFRLKPNFFIFISFFIIFLHFLRWNVLKCTGSHVYTDDSFQITSMREIT